MLCGEFNTRDRNFTQTKMQRRLEQISAAMLLTLLRTYCAYHNVSLGIGRGKDKCLAR